MGRDVRSGKARPATNESRYSAQIIVGDTEETVLDEFAVAWRQARRCCAVGYGAEYVGESIIDQPRAMYLCELALDFARQTLISGSSL